MGAEIFELLASLDREARGRALHQLARRLYPIPRSITGDGLRRTLAILGERVPLTVHEVPTGTAVFDWTVPKEWSIREAWVKDPAGQKVVDFAEHSLHVLGYSAPVHRRMPLAELREHLFSLPEQPELIPYRTSYYRETWGFCLPHRILEALPEGEYEVRIDSDLREGSLSYGEWLLPGESAEEVLVSCHACHPSLANDNLSGLAVTSELARLLGELPRRRFSYRFLWIPGTIGSITWLARNREAAGRIRAGLVAANLGDGGPFHYKQSRRGHAEIDRAVEAVLSAREEPFAIHEWSPFGYDERQYCSPGFDLPVGSLTRTPWGQYPEYHTSADHLGFITPASLGESLAVYLSVVAVLEGNRRHRNLNPLCEPQLGRRGLYGSIGGAGARESQLALLWVLSFSDGEHDLLAIAERSGLAFPVLAEAARALVGADLLATIEEEDR